ncbi:MAG: DUF4347 domain-containing protein, partial [Nitrospira sp.]|nr:DUF4347 domain-containing protein [Nitrospira sp.]
MFDGAAVATTGAVAAQQGDQQTDSPSALDDVSTVDIASTLSDGESSGDDGDAALFDALAALDASVARREVVFISPSVLEYQQLLDGISPNVEVHILDPTRDGVLQVAEILSGRTDIDAIHLIGHGSEADIQLGSSSLTQTSISTEYAEVFQQIGKSLSAEADLLIYGCDFGRGANGLTAMQTLAVLTGADVAASDDATGHADLGGDWILEQEIGQIETGVVVDGEAQDIWNHILAKPDIDLNGSTGGFNVTTAFTGQAPVNIAPLATLADSDGDSIRSLTALLGALPDGSAESLSLNASADAAASANGLTVNYNAGTGELLITGDATAAIYQTILQGILYDNTSATPTTINRSISVQVIDSAGEISVTRTATVTITANNPPTATNLSTAETYIEDTALNLTDIVVTDVDSTTVTVTLALSDVGAGSLSTGASGAVTSTYDAATGVWTASGAVADVNTLLAGVTFTPSLNYSSNFTITTSVSDGVAPAVTGTKAMTGIAVNDAPTGVTLTNQVTTIAENTVIGAGYKVADISVTDDALGTNTLSLTGTDAGSFTLVGSALYYTGASPDYETQAAYAVTVQVDDAGVGATPDASVNFTLAITNVDEVAPTITSGATAAALAENSGAGQVVYTVTSTDAD